MRDRCANEMNAVKLWSTPLSPPASTFLSRLKSLTFLPETRLCSSHTVPVSLTPARSSNTRSVILRNFQPTSACTAVNKIAFIESCSPSGNGCFGSFN